MFISSQKNLWKPHILRSRNLFWLAMLLLIAKVLVFSSIYYLPKTAHFADVTASELVALANQNREAAGLNPLSLNSELTEAAQKKAIDMLNNDYFAHISPTGITPWHWLNKVGYKYLTAGENLAKDFTESEYVNNAWMNSSSHRANILNSNFSDIGIAVVEGTIAGKRTILAVQFFGKVAAAASTGKEKVAIQPEIEVNPNINVKAETVNSLKGPEVFKTRGIISVAKIAKESEPILQKIYIIILGLVVSILMLSIFLNLRARHARFILTALVFIILVAAIASFNGGAVLNRGIDIL
jgi:hypothetical protein